MLEEEEEDDENDDANSCMQLFNIDNCRSDSILPKHKYNGMVSYSMWISVDKWF